MTRILTTSMYDVRYTMMAYAGLTEDDDPGNWRAFLLDRGRSAQIRETERVRL